MYILNTNSSVIKLFRYVLNSFLGHKFFQQNRFLGRKSKYQIQNIKVNISISNQVKVFSISILSAYQSTCYQFQEEYEFLRPRIILIYRECNI